MSIIQGHTCLRYLETHCERFHVDAAVMPQSCLHVHCTVYTLLNNSNSCSKIELPVFNSTLLYQTSVFPN